MRNSALDPAFRPRATAVPDRPEWIHEIKHDGYRPIVQRDDNVYGCGPATATTGAIGFHSFPRLRSETRNSSLVIDGQAVLLDIDGRFQRATLKQAR